MECLESRRLLSAGASLSSGVLTVTGADNVNDVVTLSSSGGTFTAIVDGTTYTFTDPVNSISVSLLSGNDSLSLDGGVPGGSANLGDGDDTMAIAPGNVGGNINIIGGNGNDQLSVTDSPLLVVFYGDAGSDSFTYDRASSGAVLSLSELELVDQTHGVNHYANIEAAVINCGAGNDDFTVWHVDFPVTVSGNGGADALQVVNPSAFSGPTSSTLTSTTLSGTDFGGLTYDVPNFSLQMPGNDNTIDVLSTRIGAKYNIDAGAGDDFIKIGDQTLNGCAGAITVTGGGGNDTLLVDDSNSTTSSSYQINSSNVDRLGFALRYFDFDGLALNAGRYGNDITLVDTMSGTPVTINGDGGADALTISGAPASAVVFNGGLDPAVQDTLNVNAGSYTFADDAALGTSNLAVNVGLNGKVFFDASQHLARLSVGGAATLSENGARFISTGNIHADGFLDLQDNDLIVRNGTEGTWNGSAYSDILGLVQSGRNSGAWNGNGIRTSSAINGNQTTLAVASASELSAGSFDGETLTGSEVLVKYTYGGDANLDGKVNIDDYGRIDAHVGQSGSVFGWYNGDFNYDGKINIDDYGIIDSVIGAQGPVL